MFLNKMRNICCVPDTKFVSATNREFKITTTATATGTSLNKRFNEQNNSCARAL